MRRIHRHVHAFTILAHVAAAHAFPPLMKTELSRTDSYVHEARVAVDFLQPATRKLASFRRVWSFFRQFIYTGIKLSNAGVVLPKLRNVNLRLENSSNFYDPWQVSSRVLFNAHVSDKRSRLQYWSSAWSLSWIFCNIYNLILKCLILPLFTRYTRDTCADLYDKWHFYNYSSEQCVLNRIDFYPILLDHQDR